MLHASRKRWFNRKERTMLPNVDFNAMSYDDGQQLVKQAGGLSDMLASLTSGAGDAYSSAAGQASGMAHDASNYLADNPALRNALIGAGGGAGLGLLSSAMQPKRRRDPVGRMLTGAGVGTLGGFGGTMAYNALKDIPEPGKEQATAVAEGKLSDLGKIEQGTLRGTSKPGEAQSGGEYFAQHKGDPLKVLTDAERHGGLPMWGAQAGAAAMPWLDKVPGVSKIPGMQTAFQGRANPLQAAGLTAGSGTPTGMFAGDSPAAQGARESMESAQDAMKAMRGGPKPAAQPPRTPVPKTTAQKAMDIGKKGLGAVKDITAMTPDARINRELIRHGTKGAVSRAEGKFQAKNTRAINQTKAKLDASRQKLSQAKANLDLARKSGGPVVQQAEANYRRMEAAHRKNITRLRGGTAQRRDVRSKVRTSSGRAPLTSSKLRQQRPNAPGKYRRGATSGAMFLLPPIINAIMGSRSNEPTSITRGIQQKLQTQREAARSALPSGQ
jgi:hypothetical protein